MSDLTVAQAVRDILLDITRTDNTHLVRQATLSVDATAGSAGPTLASLTGFAEGSVVQFDDVLGEEPLVVTSFTGNVANVDTSNLGYTGLQHTHTAGTRVYTNCFAFTPWDMAPMLDAGDPVIFVTALRDETGWLAMPHATVPTYTLHVQYHRLLMRQNTALMQPNVWAYRQETTARTDIGLIRSTLLANPTLKTAHQAAQAIQLGRRGQPDRLMQIDWGRMEVEADTWHFVATLDVIVVGAAESN